MIGCLDVHYPSHGARAACVVLDHFAAPAPADVAIATVDRVAEYEPGRFYRRELPCLLAVLGRLPRLPDVLIVDAYVWISNDGERGLGARLHEALDGRAAVVGVAKRPFRHLHAGSRLALVNRGSSARPLYVTSVGIDLATAAHAVSAMAGAHRIPDALRMADRVARGLPR